MSHKNVFVLTMFLSLTIPVLPSENLQIKNKGNRHVKCIKCMGYCYCATLLGSTLFAAELKQPRDNHVDQQKQFSLDFAFKKAMKNFHQHYDRYQKMQ